MNLISNSLFHASPPKVLYKRAEVYPAGVPINVNKTTPVVAKLPRLAGDKKPRHAKKRTIKVIRMI